MNSVDESIRARLQTQLTALSRLVEGVPEEQITRRSPGNKWSAAENIAHLAHYQDVFIDQRLRRIVAEDRPRFGRYRAEDDPTWPAFAAQPYSKTLERLRTRRADLNTLVGTLSSDALSRTGFHPLLGDATVVLWLEFFLLHEAHHLYVVLRRLHGSD